MNYFTQHYIKTIPSYVFVLVFSTCLFVSCDIEPAISDVRQTVEISRIFPTTVTSSETITITGNSFGTNPDGMQVFFNDKKGTLIKNQFSNESMVVMIPNDATIGETFIRIEKQDEAPLQASTSILIVNKIRNNLSSQDKLGDLRAAAIQNFAQNLINATGIGGGSTIVALLKEDISVYRVSYLINYLDKAIEASALVVLPSNLANLEAKASIVSIQNSTITKNDHAPTLILNNPSSLLSPASLPLAGSPERLTAFLATAVATMGQIVLMPDYIGFGSSMAEIHPYLHAEGFSTDGTAALEACLNLLAALNLRDKYDENVYLMGYSEGAYASIAMHRALETTPLQGLNVKLTSAGGGVYALNAFRNYILSQVEYPQPYLISYFVHAYSSIYESITLESIIQDPYHTSIPSLFDKTKDRVEINSKLSQNLLKLIKEDFRVGSSTESKFKSVIDALNENSLLNWNPQSPINFYHGDADEVIPAIHSKIAHTRLQQRAKTMEDINFYSLSGNHVGAAIPFFLAALQNIITDKQASNN